MCEQPLPTPIVETIDAPGPLWLGYLAQFLGQMCIHAFSSRCEVILDSHLREIENHAPEAELNDGCTDA